MSEASLVKIDIKFWWDGTYWVAEVPALSLSTQGIDRIDAKKMAIDAIQCLTEDKDFRVCIIECGEGLEHVTSNNDKILSELIMQRNPWRVAAGWQADQEPMQSELDRARKRLAQAEDYLKR